MAKTPKDGIPCPQCGSTELRAYYVRRREGSILRVRTCPAGHRVRTVEAVQLRPPRK